MAYMKDKTARRIDAVAIDPKTITPGIPARRNRVGEVVVASAADSVPRASSALALVFNGDSTTKGNQDGTGVDVPSEVAKQLDGVTVTNEGVSGRTSTEIAMRQGGVVPLLTFAGGQVPASGAATVTVSPAGTWRTGVVETFSFVGALKVSPTVSIPGTLAHNETSDAWTFTRTTGGSVVPLSGATPFIMTTGDGHRASFQVIQGGINNYAATDFLDTVRDIDAMLRHLTADEARYVVLPILTSDTQIVGTTAYDNIAEANRRLINVAGKRNFLDHRRFLIDKGLAVAGITPVAGDATDIGNDTVPRSGRFDNLHLNAAFYRTVARLIANYLVDNHGFKAVDPLNVPGTLYNFEPGSAWNGWAAGVPANGAQLQNLAAHRLADLGFDTGLHGTWSADATANDGTHGIMERTSKGGLHGIISPTNPPANNVGAGIAVDNAIHSWIEANPKHEYALLLSGRVTRTFTGSFSFNYVQMAYNSGGYKGIGYLGTGAPMPVSTFRKLNYQQNQNTVGALVQDVYGMPDTPLASASAGVENRLAATWGKLARANQTLTGLNSWILYKSVLIDVTASGLSRTELHSRLWAWHKKNVESSGGRYFGDTFTDPATLA